MSGGGTGMGLQRNQSMYPGGMMGGGPRPIGRSSPFGGMNRPGMGGMGGGMGGMGMMGRGGMGGMGGMGGGNQLQRSPWGNTPGGVLADEAARTGAPPSWTNQTPYTQTGNGPATGAPMGTYFREPPPPQPAPDGMQPRPISDPYRQFREPQAPRMMDSSGMMPPGSGGGGVAGGGGVGNPTGGVRDAMGNVYAGRESAPRAYDAGTFNPNAGQWAQYGNPQSGTPFAQTVNGMNFLNGQLWGPEGLSQGGPAFQNFVDHYGPIWNSQRGY